jgi:hypothetical protein
MFLPRIFWKFESVRMKDNAQLYIELVTALEAAETLANCLQVSAESVHVLTKLAEAKYWASRTPESAAPQVPKPTDADATPESTGDERPPTLAPIGLLSKIWQAGFESGYQYAGGSGAISSWPDWRDAEKSVKDILENHG